MPLLPRRLDPRWYRWLRREKARENLQVEMMERGDLFPAFAGYEVVGIMRPKEEHRA